jgi:hypothetical protein
MEILVNCTNKNESKVVIKRIFLRLFKKLKNYFTKDIISKIETNSILLAQIQISRIKELKQVSSLKEVEFKVFSEWGEDGIIQYIINNIEIKNKIFVEFGVQDYKESNTRFLLINDLWKGLVIDSDEEYISEIKKDDIYFKYDLTAKRAFITRENINNLISTSDISGEIGLLSIDIDGNDYWVWEAINIVDPAIVICEYNALFGPTYQVTIPYDPNFHRTKAHFSNLYFGASLPALVILGGKKGYDFVGSNSSGSNAFFVKRELSAKLKKYSAKEGFREPGFRQSRDPQGQLTFLNKKESEQVLGSMDVINIETGKTILLKEMF